MILIVDSFLFMLLTAVTCLQGLQTVNLGFSFCPLVTLDLVQQCGNVRGCPQSLGM
jgi:hypothetical protein